MGHFGKAWPAGSETKGLPVIKQKGNVRVRNATKVVHPDGTKFHSRLEMYLYSQLKMLGVPHELQHRIVIRPLFPAPAGWGKTKNVYSMNWYVDFYFPWCKVLLDAKGFMTEVAKIKIELVLYRMHTGELPYKQVRMAKNKAACRDEALHMKALHQQWERAQADRNF